MTQLSKTPDQAEAQEVKVEGKYERVQPKTVSCPKAEHRYVIRNQTEGVAAECDRCHIGFLLPPGAELTDNHVYLHGTLLI